MESVPRRPYFVFPSIVVKLDWSATPVLQPQSNNISDFYGKFTYFILRVADVYYSEDYKHTKQNKIIFTPMSHLFFICI